MIPNIFCPINYKDIDSIGFKEEIHIKDLFGDSNEKDLYRSLVNSKSKNSTIYGKLYECSKPKFGYPRNSIRTVKTIDQQICNLRKFVNYYLYKAERSGSRVYVRFNTVTDSYEEINGEE